MPRGDGRASDALRPVGMTVDYLRHAEGSVLIEFGETRVLCAATVEERVPPFLEGRGQGWVTAEYAMLPRAGTTRSQRESVAGKVGGRTHEIQRLIGRSLRAALDLRALGERTIILDCDVLQADGGTRTAAITGAWVALKRACLRLQSRGTLRADPVRVGVAAVSVGIVKGKARVAPQPARAIPSRGPWKVFPTQWRVARGPEFTPRPRISRVQVWPPLAGDVRTWLLVAPPPHTLHCQQVGRPLPATPATIMLPRTFPIAE